jgi:glycosyltransferase involved in cell wall biosynthesis
MTTPRCGVRVLFWSELFPPYIGGNEMVAAGLLPALRDRGHEFSVVTSHQELDLPDRDEYRGIPVHRYPFRAALTSRSIDTITALRREARALVARIAPELIHVSCVGPSSYFLPLASGRAVPLIAHLHAEVLASQTPGDGSILRRVLERADWVTSVSAAVHAGAVDTFPCIRGRSSVITNAVEAPRLPASALPFDPPCLLCLGRLVPEKGFDVALHVFAEVARRVPGVRLLLAGDGPERARLAEQAHGLGLDGRVEFLGAVPHDEVPSLIERATVVLMPSRREGLGLVAIEAAYMGRPTVATRVAGLVEVVLHGETGLLAPGEDAGALSRAVLTLLARPEAARRMGEAARRRAREVFDLRRCADRFDELYRRLARRCPEPLAVEAGGSRRMMDR